MILLSPHPLGVPYQVIQSTDTIMISLSLAHQVPFLSSLVGCRVHYHFPIYATGQPPLRMDAFMGMEIDFLAWPSLFLSWWALVQASSQRRRNLFTHLLYLGKAHPKYSLSIWPDKARERISHASDTWDSSFRYAPPFHEHNHHAWRRFSKRITNDKRDR